MTDPNAPAGAEQPAVPPVPPAPAAPPAYEQPAAPAAPPVYEQPAAPAYTQPAPPAAPAASAYAAAPGTPAYAPAPAADTFPGKGLGIAGLIVAIFFPLIGLILSLVANSQSKKAGFKNGPAKAGIIVGAILLVLGIIVGIIFTIIGITAASTVIDACSQLGPGVWELDGVTYTCE